MSRSRCRIPAKRTTVTGVRAPAADAQTIRPDAQLLFVTGAGWTKKQADGQAHAPEAEKLIRDFLQRSARVAGQQQIAGGPERRRPGGAVVPVAPEPDRPDRRDAAPSQGLSTCCHGEEPHTVGWRFITERRAINLDPNCGWARGKADVLYVADAFAR